MELFYRRFGIQGNQPVIILHGLFGISDNWVTFGRRIADEGFDVIIPDQRNHGASPQSDIFNYLALTDDLIELITQLQLINPMIIGHSMGGKVGMLLALENPEIVKRLIVVDIGIKAYGERPHHREIIDAMQSVVFTQQTTRQEVEIQLKDRVKEQRIRQFLMKNLHWDENKQLEWRINLTAISNNLNQMFDAIEMELAFQKPVLFIRGGASDYILPEDYAPIRHSFPKAEIITIEGATHWLIAEVPEQFYLLSSGFLTGQPGWLTALNL